MLENEQVLLENAQIGASDRRRRPARNRSVHGPRNFDAKLSIDNRPNNSLDSIERAREVVPVDREKPAERQ